MVQKHFIFETQLTAIVFYTGIRRGKGEQTFNKHPTSISNHPSIHLDIPFITHLSITIDLLNIRLSINSSRWRHLSDDLIYFEIASWQLGSDNLVGITVKDCSRSFIESEAIRQHVRGLSGGVATRLHRGTGFTFRIKSGRRLHQIKSKDTTETNQLLLSGFLL